MILKINCLFLMVLLSCAVKAEDADLLELSVEDLLNVEVTSVSKKAQSLNDAAAAIFVITNEDIKRTGVTSIPEALRLAPGLDVARIDANKWAVSVRGFNGRFANKLLVLVDGRSTYTRAFAGVYWESQDVMLEDVDRIEVIRGPGATLWGANAVNGVINIITKHSSETQGGLLAAGGGTEEQGFGAFRYGGQLNADTTGRVYVKGFKRDENTFLSGGEAGDDWDKVQGGFRVDSQLSNEDELTVQGDIYHSNISQSVLLPQVTPPYQTNFKENVTASGGNILGRLQHTFSATSDYSLQFYYDFYKRNETLFEESRNTLDLDFQHRFGLSNWHDVVWGLGYRYSHDDFPTSSFSSVTPASRNDQLFSAFIQDEMTLIDNTLWLTIGSKFEHNDYSGFEGQPTARIMWAPHHQHRLWAAVSRAVRTPSRAEHDASILNQVIPPQAFPFPATALFIQGDDNFKAEDVISYEVGYRTSFANAVSIDITGFYNDYSNLRSVTTQVQPFNGSYVPIMLVVDNGNKAETYGFEVATAWQMLDWWRWDINYSFLKTQMNEAAKAQIGLSPEQRLSLRSAISPWQNVDFDVWFRYVDANFAISSVDDSAIKGYVTLDLRLAYRPVKDLELSLVGQNLLADKHFEYRQENQTLPTAIDRGMYGKITWQF